ncbi:MAG: L,D-transpeptidase [Firmicutes bacterium]|jgi:murein L,D-transpeptidase YafK|nr:L,D-transpeptidase [Bacillota bacterium]
MKIFKNSKIKLMLITALFIVILFSIYLVNKPKAPQALISSDESLIKIYKSERILELYINETLTDTFSIGLGSSPKGDKYKEGDKKTPVGKYYVCTRNEKSRFTLFLGLSYPDIEDAKNALDNDFISKETYDSIVDAIEKGLQPPWKTKLGGEVGIHGGGSNTDWTWGCISLSDEDVKKLWLYAPLNTPVEIYE